MNNWQPIETAPKESRKSYLVWCEENKCTFCVYWEKEESQWRIFGGLSHLSHTPTHWQPLPEPPQ